MDNPAADANEDGRFVIYSKFYLHTKHHWADFWPSHKLVSKVIVASVWSKNDLTKTFGVTW